MGNTTETQLISNDVNKPDKSCVKIPLLTAGPGAANRTFYKGPVSLSSNFANSVSFQIPNILAIGFLERSRLL